MPGNPRALITGAERRFPVRFPPGTAAFSIKKGKTRCWDLGDGALRKIQPWPDRLGLFYPAA